MAFVTRCPDCLSTFRVVEDQLRVAGGWVRCGRCGTPFSAPQARVDIESQGGAAVAGRAAPAPALARQETEAPPPAVWPRSVVDDSPAPPPLAQRPVAAPAPALARTDENADLDARRHARLPGSAVLGAEGGAIAVKDSHPSTVQAPDLPVLPELDSDDLARGRRLLGAGAPHARPAAKRRRAAGGGSRWAWGGVAAGASTALGLQLLVAWHDQVAQAVPVLRPAVEVVCVMVDCRVEAARLPEMLDVESSRLAQLGGTVYEFSLVLRNRAERELVAPAIDLKLTNPQGEVVIRRVLRLSELGHRARTIGARQELTLQAALSTGDSQIAGFNIELFYP